MEEKRCYTVKELQQILGISRPTVYELLKRIPLDSGWNKIPDFKEKF